MREFDGHRTSFETPKSASLALPSRVRRMLPAFTSWITKGDFGQDNTE